MEFKREISVLLRLPDAQHCPARGDQCGSWREFVGSILRFLRVVGVSMGPRDMRFPEQSSGATLAGICPFLAPGIGAPSIKSEQQQRTTAATTTIDNPYRDPSTFSGTVIGDYLCRHLCRAQSYLLRFRTWIPRE